MNAFKHRIQFFLQYYFLWIGFFFFARLFFLLFYYEDTCQLGFYEVLKTFLYGFRLDASFTGYLSILPFFLILGSLFIPRKVISFLIKLFTYSAIILINLLMIIDASLYQSWGIRIDNTLLNYLNTPEVDHSYSLLPKPLIVLAFVIVSCVVKVLETMTNKVVSGSRCLIISET